MFKICIDPGHGGSDYGASHQDIVEKTLNMEWAFALDHRLKALNLQTKLTRAGDADLSLAQRVAIANKWGADIFLSLHHNAAVVKAHGFEVYHFTNSKKGALLAQYLEEEFLTFNTKRYVGPGVKCGSQPGVDYYVNTHTKMPAVVIEPLFITNAMGRKLYNPYIQADLVVNAVCKYFNIVRTKAITYSDVLQEVTPNHAVVWEKGIKAATSAAKLDEFIGDLEIMKYLPDLIVKIRNHYASKED